MEDFSKKDLLLVDYLHDEAISSLYHFDKKFKRLATNNMSKFETSFLLSKGISIHNGPIVIYSALCRQFFERFNSRINGVSGYYTIKNTTIMGTVMFFNVDKDVDTDHVRV